jgi:hypothetical protein
MEQEGETEEASHLAVLSCNPIRTTIKSMLKRTIHDFLRYTIIILVALDTYNYSSRMSTQFLLNSNSRDFRRFSGHIIPEFLRGRNSEG